MREITRVEEIQEILFESLCYFDDFCSKHGIQYFLSNGTLLGAVKYGRFIPWDDDVDVLLPRNEYNKLVSMPEINNGKYRLLCSEQFPEWRRPYSKLSYEYTVVNEGNCDFGMDFGVSVDIFPIDNWNPLYPIAWLEAFCGELSKRMLVCSVGGEFYTKKTGIKRFILHTIWHFGKKIGYQSLLKKINNSVKRGAKYKNKYMGCRAWVCHSFKEVLPAAVFEKNDNILFCNRSFPVPIGYKKYLDNLYGDWKKELPAEEQHSNHEIKVWWKDER